MVATLSTRRSQVDSVATSDEAADLMRFARVVYHGLHSRTACLLIDRAIARLLRDLGTGKDRDVRAQQLFP